MIPLDTEEEPEEFEFWALPVTFFWVLGLGGGWLAWVNGLL